MDDVDNLTTDSFDTNEIASAIEEAGAWKEPAPTPRRGGGLWWVLLLIVVVFGYLSAARRASFGRFAEQVGDIIHDFRGYDPEF